MTASDRHRTAGPCAPDVPDLLVSTALSAPVPGRPVAWWALDNDGHDVVVQRVRPPGGPGGPDEATLRRRLAHPHVAPLLRVVRCREGAVQVLGPVGGGCLADVLGERHLRVGEVVTLVAGLGSALEALHDEGFAHGELTAAGVLVDDAGMPLLLGLGAARPLPPPGRAQRRRELRGSGPAWGSAEEDVRALARLALRALGDGSPGVSASPARRVVSGTERDATLVDLLAGLLTGAAEAAAGRAPSATQLARACWTVAPAEPLQAVPVAEPDRPSGTAITQRVRRVAARAAVDGAQHPRGRTARLAAVARRVSGWAARRPSRVALVTTGAGAVLAGVAATAFVLLPSTGSTAVASPAADVVVAAATAASPTPTSGATTPAATTPAASPSSSDPTSDPTSDQRRAVDPRLTGDDPAAAVRVLAQLRVEAMTSGEVALLDVVDVPGSSAATADAALLESLAGTRLEGLTVSVVSAEMEQRSGDEAQVEVVAAMSAHRRTSGSEVVEVPAGQPVTSRLVLQRDDGRWRVAATA